MKTYTIPRTQLLLNDSYDVIVVGGGPSGCVAAAAASRDGAKTLLIESTTALGGMSTMGLVPNWSPFTNREEVIYRGLAWTVFQRAKEGLPHIPPEAIDWVAINPEHLKRVYDQLMDEFHVTVLFQSMIVDAYRAPDGTLEAAVVANKAGLTAFRASVWIDATGDADLIAFAGGAFHLGGEQHEIQSQTLCFSLSGVDHQAFERGPWLNRANKQSPAYLIRDSARYPMVIDPHMCAKRTGNGTIGFNAGHVPLTDVTDPFSLSVAYRNGREIAHEISEGLREFHPEAFGQNHLAFTAPLLGVRESRRIVGDYTLTLQDYQDRRGFEDEIARNNYFLDLHPVTIPGQPERKVELPIAITPYRKGESHGIPYRCLIPKDLTNVLAAGRSISVERFVQGSIRVMPCVMTIGEAAGVAAAMAANRNGDVRAIDISAMQKRLLDAGAYILPGGAS
jgi:hypothetical protein